MGLLSAEQRDLSRTAWVSLRAEVALGAGSGSGRQGSGIPCKTGVTLQPRESRPSPISDSAPLPSPQASCTRETGRTSLCLSSHLSSGASWATGAAGAFPVPAATASPTATSSWPPWPSRVVPTAASMWEISTTSEGSSPPGTSPTSWS